MGTQFAVCHGYLSMRFHGIVCFLLAGLAFGQVAPPTTPAAKDHGPGVKVGVDDPVITINGFCPGAAQTNDGCKTVVTRVQFEKLTEALQPGMSLSLRLNVANAYARNLKMSVAAEKRSLDKTPAFEEEMRFARMQLLAQDLDRALHADASNISDAELADYYKKNESSYEQATLVRIFIPRATKGVATDETVQQESAGEEMTKLAAALRARAVNGEDPDKLQIEAYAAGGFPSTSPHTTMDKIRRVVLPLQHETVFDLKPGEVSAVFSDPDGAHFIYKMISKQALALEDVKAEIRTAISSQRYRESMKSFQGDVVFSDAYFNPPGESAKPPERVRRARRKTAQPGQDSD
jgi:bifunctional DNA-binding transcriptional regulator/antitoxin component of YhaV-PrlF toxin-antitoxin module